MRRSMQRCFHAEILRCRCENRASLRKERFYRNRFPLLTSKPRACNEESN